jgi:hypothetical protein
MMMIVHIIIGCFPALRYEESKYKPNLNTCDMLLMLYREAATALPPQRFIETISLDYIASQVFVNSYMSESDYTKETIPSAVGPAARPLSA